MYTCIQQMENDMKEQQQKINDDNDKVSCTWYWSKIGLQTMMMTTTWQTWNAKNNLSTHKKSNTLRAREIERWRERRPAKRASKPKWKIVSQSRRFEDTEKSQYTREHAMSVQHCVVSVRLVTGHLIIFAYILSFVSRLLTNFFFPFKLCTLSFMLSILVACVCERLFHSKANTYRVNCILVFFLHLCIMHILILKFSTRFEAYTVSKLSWWVATDFITSEQQPQ